MKTHNSLDMAKYIASVCVIAAHTIMTHPNENMIHILLNGGFFRLIVPFFLCCTGFLLAENIENPKYIYKFMKKQLKLYLLCSAFYLPIQLIGNVISDGLANFSLFDNLQEILFVGSFFHLWYFPAAILGVFILHKLIIHFNTKIVILISAMLYIFGLCGNAYYTLIDNDIFSSFMGTYLDVFLTTRNALFYAVPVVLIGILISKYQIRVSAKVAFSGLLMSIMCLLAEVYIVYAHSHQFEYDIFIFTLPTTFFIFNLITKTGIKRDCKKLRSYSTWIYIIHPAVYGVLMGIVNIFKIPYFDDIAILRFILVFITTQGIIILMQKKKALS